jgi:hypothetical protein
MCVSPTSGGVQHIRLALQRGNFIDCGTEVQAARSLVAESDLEALTPKSDTRIRTKLFETNSKQGLGKDPADQAQIPRAFQALPPWRSCGQPQWPRRSLPSGLFPLGACIIKASFLQINGYPNVAAERPALHYGRL